MVIDSTARMYSHCPIQRGNGQASLEGYWRSGTSYLHGEDTHMIELQRLLTRRVTGVRSEKYRVSRRERSALGHRLQLGRPQLPNEVSDVRYIHQLYD